MTVHCCLSTPCPICSPQTHRVSFADGRHDRIVALTRENEDLKAALRYIAQPTMGLPSGPDPAKFALDGAKEEHVRLALSVCIYCAKTALESPVSGNYVVEGKVQGLDLRLDAAEEALVAVQKMLEDGHPLNEEWFEIISRAMEPVRDRIIARIAGDE